MLPLWDTRMQQLIEAAQPDALICELLDCLPLTTTDGHLAALDNLVGYFRNNEARMQYAHFRELGLPVGSGIVESAHRHVLQTRMKRAGQRWGLTRGRRMARLRAAYRTAGARRFHRALLDARQATSTRRTAHRALPNGPRRAKHNYVLSPSSRLNRAAASI